MRFSARCGSVSLPAQLGVQAWLQGEGVPRACWVVAKAVRLRSEALQRRRGVSLGAQRERKAAEARLVFRTFILTHVDERLYLQEGGLHGGVVESTQGSWGGGGREGRHPWEGQQGWEATTSWRLKPRTHKHSNLGSITHTHPDSDNMFFLFYTFDLVKSDLEHLRRSKRKFSYKRNCNDYGKCSQRSRQA